MRVLTSDDLNATCGCHERIAARFGPAAPAVELAISTLRAVRSLPEFFSLPNVTKEEDVIFTAPEADVRLTLNPAGKRGADECVEMTAVSVTPATSGE